MPEPFKQRLLVGLGSHHGDDQVGWQLVEALGKHVSIPTRQASVPADLLHWMEGVDELYLCDACQGSGPVGSLHRWEYRDGEGGFDAIMEDLSSGGLSLRSTNSHQLSLVAVLRLAKSLNLLPRRVVIWGVEGRQFHPGKPLSEALFREMAEIVKQLASEFSHA